jgi:ferredoxin-NADP reductase
MTITERDAARDHMPGPWRLATVVDVRDETADAKTFRLRLAEARPHLAGQHYIVRLTAPDGYRAQRSYSVASAPDGDIIELTVEHLPGGEVSGFLHEAVVPGDRLEIRGPIGAYFTWDAQTPALGIAGGSGVVPVMAMLRTARRLHRRDLIRVMVSVRGPDELYYPGELPGPEATVVYTRRSPPGDRRPAGRLAPGDLATVIRGESQIAYVSGSPAFCDAVAAILGDLQVHAARIRVERFGFSG